MQGGGADFGLFFKPGLLPKVTEPSTPILPDLPRPAVVRGAKAPPQTNHRAERVSVETQYTWPFLSALAFCFILLSLSPTLCPVFFRSQLGATEGVPSHGLPLWGARALALWGLWHGFPLLGPVGHSHSALLHRTIDPGGHAWSTALKRLGTTRPHGKGLLHGPGWLCRPP